MTQALPDSETCCAQREGRVRAHVTCPNLRSDPTDGKMRLHYSRNTFTTLTEDNLIDPGDLIINSSTNQEIID